MSATRVAVLVGAGRMRSVRWITSLLSIERALAALGDVVGRGLADDGVFRDRVAALQVEADAVRCPTARQAGGGAHQPRAGDAAARHRPHRGAGLPRRPRRPRGRRFGHGARRPHGLATARGPGGGPRPPARPLAPAGLGAERDRVAGQVLGLRLRCPAQPDGAGRAAARRSVRSRSRRLVGGVVAPAPALQPSRALASCEVEARRLLRLWSATMRRWSAAEPNSRSSALAPDPQAHVADGAAAPTISMAWRVTSAWHSPMAALADEAACPAHARRARRAPPGRRRRGQLDGHEHVGQGVLDGLARHPAVAGDVERRVEQRPRAEPVEGKADGGLVEGSAQRLAGVGVEGAEHAGVGTHTPLSSTLASARVGSRLGVRLKDSSSAGTTNWPSVPGSRRAATTTSLRPKRPDTCCLCPVAASRRRRARRWPRRCRGPSVRPRAAPAPVSSPGPRPPGTGAPEPRCRPRARRGRTGSTSAEHAEQRPVPAPR